MTDILSRIEEILAEELSMYEQIYEIEKKKGEAIINREAEMLSRLTVQEEECLSGITALEDERQKQISNYSRMNKIEDTDSVTLSKLVDDKKSRDFNALKNTGDRLKGVLEQIKDVQKVNEDMLIDNIEFYNLLFDDLRDQELSTGAYGSDGRESVRKGGSLLLNTRA